MVAAARFWDSGPPLVAIRRRRFEVEVLTCDDPALDDLTSDVLRTIDAHDRERKRGVRLARIGIMTGGGDCPGLNAVVRAVVKRGLALGHELIGIEYGFRGLVEPGLARPLSHADISGILPRGGTILGTSNRANPFAYPVTEGDAVVEKDLSDQAIGRARELRLDGLIAAGGDGTLLLARKLMEKGLPIVGVPKTIDNDLTGTDQTFGFATARDIATEAVDRLHSTAEAHDRVMVLEVMGRNSGFIALESGIAGGADVVLIPEIPYRLEAVVEKIQQRKAMGRRFSIAVIAEGAHPAGGQQSIEEEATPGRGVVRLGGSGRHLAEALADAINLEVRVTVLGHLQRGGSPSAFDRLLASRLGAHAITLVEEGRWGHVAVLRGSDITDIPITEEVTTQKQVDPNGQLCQLARQLGISLGE